MKKRVNASTSISAQNHWREDYCYDNINRLIKTNRVTRMQHGNDLGTYSAPVCPQQGADQDTEYDGFGNITRKAGVGVYNYNMGDVSSISLGDGLASPSRPGPHALSSTEEANGTVYYYYDANGNMLSDGKRTFTYTTYDMVSEITKGQHVTSFKYGPSRARYYRKDDKTNVAGAVISSQETWYLGNIEKVKLADGTIKWRRHLSGGALHTYHTNADGSIIDTGAPVQRRYLLNDHLGSTDIVMDAVGGLEQAMSFDAWGQRRDPEGMQQYTATQLANFDHSITTKGFTGHEMLDEVGVVHMNGRIYDPRLGRFLQADPVIQAPTYTQSLNRYSYVFNNPLNATDPSGYSAIVAAWAFAAIKTAAVEIVKMIVVKAMVYAAATTFISTWVQGANFGDAIAAGAIAGLSAAFSAGAGFGLAAVGMEWLTIPVLSAIGGVAADIQGGDFGLGFAAAGLGTILGGVTSNLSGSTRFVVGVVGAGAISKVTGGKFSSGAGTSAFSSLFVAPLLLSGAGREFGDVELSFDGDDDFCNMAVVSCSYENRSIGVNFTEQKITADVRLLNGLKLIDAVSVAVGVTGAVKWIVKKTVLTFFSKGVTKSGPKLLTHAPQTRFFKGDEAVIHFERHGSELMEAFGRKSYSLKDYLDDANYVIKNGTFVPEANAYVRLIGGKGSAKYGFVGLDRATGNITTFHVKSVGVLAKKAPSLGLSK